MNEILADMSENNVMDTITDTDAVLMLSVSKGDDNAFRILVQKWKNPIINYFFRSTNDAFLSEDLTWQTFINLYKARASYKVKAKFSTYLFFIARCVLINNHRSAKPVEAVDPSDMESCAVFEDASSAGELEELFENMIKDMPENQRTAILLLKQQQLSYDEIAEAMSASVGAVKTWIHRARETLRKAFKEYE